MICNKCNSEIADNSKFCQVCGNAIDSLENVVPIIDNSMDNQLINSSDIVQESTVNTNSIISDDSNYNQTNNIELWDIYKSQEQNIIEKPIIPIYDLNLYGANFEGTYWIDGNGNVLDIIQKQTKIPTVNAKINIVYD